MILDMEGNEWKDERPIDYTVWASDMLVSMITAVNAMDKVKNGAPEALYRVCVKNDSRIMTFSEAILYLEFRLCELRRKTTLNIVKEGYNAS